MNILIYPKCTTCKKAVKWLKDNNVEAEIRHIVEEPLSKEEINKVPEDLWRAENFDKSLIPEGFKLVYDESKNSARLNNKPYVSGSEGTYGFIIDGYIVSDNIEVVSVETLGQDYRYSDHNPVRLKYKLK